MENTQVKSKSRVSKFGEVFTSEREVKAMCDMIPPEIWQNIDSTFLEPACGTGNFLAEILERKLKLCKKSMAGMKDGIKALGSLYGVDIQQDNVEQCRDRLLDIFMEHFSYLTDYALLQAIDILDTHIVCDDMLNPQTEIVKSWGITVDKDYVKFLERRKVK